MNQKKKEKKKDKIKQNKKQNKTKTKANKQVKQNKTKTNKQICISRYILIFKYRQIQHLNGVSGQLRCPKPGIHIHSSAMYIYTFEKPIK